jgi:hypothetical protein
MVFCPRPIPRISELEPTNLAILRSFEVLLYQTSFSSRSSTNGTLTVVASSRPTARCTEGRLADQGERAFFPFILVRCSGRIIGHRTNHLNLVGRGWGCTWAFPGVYENDKTQPEVGWASPGQALSVVTLAMFLTMLFLQKGSSSLRKVRICPVLPAQPCQIFHCLTVCLFLRVFRFRHYVNFLSWFP